MWSPVYRKEGIIMSLVQILIVIGASILGFILGMFLGRKLLKKIDI